MKCAGCGNELNMNGKFCAVCGREIKESDRMNSNNFGNITNNSYCLKCGRDIPLGEKFCANCLGSKSQENAVKKEETTVEKSSSKKGLIAAIVILSLVIVVCLGIIFWFLWNDGFYSDKDKNSEDSENKTYEQTDTIYKKENDSDDNIVIENKDNNKEEEEEYAAPYFENVEASSEYKSYVSNGMKYTYYAEQVTDDDPTTAWTPESGDSSPWIEFSSEEEQRVERISIENGYSKTEDLYYQNLRAKEILVECDGFKKKYTLKDMGCQVPETIVFDEPVVTRSIKITILSAYESEERNGIKFNDLAISEIDIY